MITNQDIFLLNKHDFSALVLFFLDPVTEPIKTPTKNKDFRIHFLYPAPERGDANGVSHPGANEKKKEKKNILPNPKWLSIPHIMVSTAEREIKGNVTKKKIEVVFLSRTRLFHET